MRCQMEQIREGGLPVLRHKFYSFAFFIAHSLFHMIPNFMALPLALPVVLLTRLMRPWMLVRFGCLCAQRIGHYTLNTEQYLCQKEAGLIGQRSLDLFYNYPPITNRQLKKMWDRNKSLHVSWFVSPLYWANNLLPGSEKHVVELPGDRDIQGLLACTDPHLSFTPEEEERGQDALRLMGIREGAEFVCFHARSSAYLRKDYSSGTFQYHDYRNSCIHNYIHGAEEMARRGYFAMRMGAVVEEALNSTNPRIIDYATNFRTDFLDIYLLAKCRFYIGDTAGLCGVPAIFRHPVAMANLIPLEHINSWVPNDLSIPKKHWLRKEMRFMSFPEILDSGAGRFTQAEQFEQLGIELIENTSEEIAALAMEMDERLKGTWEINEEDEELQKRFWALFRNSDLHGVIRSRIGTEFLRQNRELLD